MGDAEAGKLRQSAYSDFPPPADSPNFMHHSGMLEYLTQYSKNFDLNSHIRFNHVVESMRTSAGEADTSCGDGSEHRWTVSGRDTTTGQSFTLHADAVVVCSGHHAVPKWPDLPGLRDAFRGRVVHAREYRRASMFEDRRVLVLGMGNSGGDIAVELSYVCPQVYMSTRRGTWVAPRLAPGGLPMDVTMCTRALNTARSLLPFDIGARTFERVLNSHFDHKMYGLKPAHHAINQQPFVNDVLPSRILTGTVQIRGNVSRLGPDYAEFRDGSRVVIDDVIVATGYSKHYPFLPPEVAPYVREDRVELYKFIFPVEDPSVAFVGLVEPIGGFWPVAEMQARYVARVLSGKLPLPDVERQRKEAARRASALAIDSARYAAQVHWIAYMDELASILGVKPNLSRLAITDPVLYKRCVFGPCLPYQFRLEGPHSWDGAREAILDFPKRVASVLTPLTAPEGTRLRRATAGAIDIAATCTVMILIAYVLSLAI
ncbi:flavin-containing monooxygenase 5 [Rhipicephalus sanguineus]|uniref:flavin-containing monooxygenase 5 n=1 Tax=Rhipicephalus sanguineus TaxID=34632 RepID=UPI0020C574C8|nr:flavin-containing monooxygenase 5 [Rhipicephalus sanguineus]